MECNYCQKECEWVENKEIYGKNYGKSYMIWLCKDCDAYVGCHNNTKKSKGTLADKELRQLRKESKELFIQHLMGGNWNCNKMTKSMAYSKLSDLFILRDEAFHFGSSTIEECKMLIDYFTNDE